MITLEQAKRLHRGEYLHDDRDHKDKDGRCPEWKVAGRVETWVRQPERVRVPVKYGLRAHGQFTDGDLQYLHFAADCPHLTVYFHTQEPGVYNIDLYDALDHKIGDGRLVNLETSTNHQFGWSWTIVLLDRASTILTEGKVTRFRVAKIRIRHDVHMAEANPQFAGVIRQAREEVKSR